MNYLCLSKHKCVILQKYDHFTTNQLHDLSGCVFINKGEKDINFKQYKSGNDIGSHLFYESAASNNINVLKIILNTVKRSILSLEKDILIKPYQVPLIMYISLKGTNS